MDTLLIARARAATESTRSTKMINDLIEDFCFYGDARFSASTMTTRRTHLHQFGEFCRSISLKDISKVNNRLVDIYIDDYTRSHSKSTTSTSIRILRAFFIWVEGNAGKKTGVDIGSLHTIRVRDELPKAIDFKIIQKVVNNCRTEQDAIAISLAAEAGLRIGEIVEVHIMDIRGASIKVNGKGGIERTARMTKFLARRIEKFVIDNNRLDGDYLIKNRFNGRGDKMKTKALRDRIQAEFMRTAGIKMIPHQLRHSFAIQLLSNGCDIVTIQKLMGHSDINTTRIYLRIVDEFVDESYDAAMTSVSWVLT